MRGARNGWLALIMFAVLMTACSPSPSEQVNEPPSRDDAGTNSDASTPGPEEDATTPCREGEQKSCECTGSLSGVSRCDAAGAWSSCACASSGRVRGRIVSTADSLALAGVEVLATTSKQRALSADDGRFELEVAAGESIELRKQGYVSRLTPALREGEDDLELFLRPMTLEVDVDTASGGSIDAADDIRIVVPAGVQMRNAAGDVVTGTVTLQVATFDSADSGEQQALPEGDAVNLAGEKVHLTLGAAIEVSAFADGEPVNIGEGSYFDIELPAASDGAPLESTFWHYDTATGTWREEVSATRTVSPHSKLVYRARVSHLSYWTTAYVCGAPEACVTGRVVQNGEPVAGVAISSYRQRVWSSCWWHGSHYSDAYYYYNDAQRMLTYSCVAHADGGTTAADGTFRITGTPGNAHHYFVSARGYLSGSFAYGTPSETCKDVGDIELRPHQGTSGCGYNLSKCADTPLACAETYADPMHCGQCGRACEGGRECDRGQCSCPPHTQECYAQPPDGGSAWECIDTLEDREHCGGCGNRCGEGQECVLGKCEDASCPEGYTRCGVSCVDLSADDPKHCGACGNSCSGRTSCRSGRCSVDAVCGDRFVDAPEVCDDGTNQGDYGGCMPGCKAFAPRCGDGVLHTDAGELCENGSDAPCPSACNDDKACTSDALVGKTSSCDARCVHTEITAAAHGDGCCVPGSNANADGDCAPLCGNAIIERTEACDDGVNDGRYDGCAVGCATLGPRCGDGVVQTAAGESCDPKSATPCPASCDDKDACTVDSSTGDAETCTLVCKHAEITEPAPGDLCCPDGANALTDEDCPAVCGNGVVELSETCDDGINDNRYEGCASNCKALGPHCGDDIVQPGELCDGESCQLHCDDGFKCTTDRYAGSAVDCTSHCEFDPITAPKNDDMCCPEGANRTTDSDCPAICGNNVLEPGEVCDDANTADGDACSSNCKSKEVCGNRIVDVVKGEVCDDGNTAAGDGCNATCTSNESCGNKIVDVEKGEVCDDGNTKPNDGCSATCTSTEQCGNSQTDPGEVCDDGDLEGGDGCSADCKSDETCGNAITDVAVGEVCDDGAKFDGDGCSSNCKSDESCGNEIIDVFAGEVCDDGNQESGDGCNAICNSNESCGNGVRDGSEACDDGDTESDDGCNASCSSDESCGNGYPDPLEACDDGNNTAGDGCNDACTSDESCGNAYLDPHEACEDGNTVSDDGCNATCTSDETCGNAYLDPEEACDDGGTADGDGCNATCTSDETCGNAYLDPGEVCDDGNTEPGDNCSADCTSLGVCENGSCNGATLAAGGGHTCIIRSGSVFCWGVNFYGQVGDGTTTYPLTAVEVPGLSNVVAISGGRDHTCALRDTGDVYCWGRGLNYRLGNFATDNALSPTLVSGQTDGGSTAALPNARALSAGGAHSCMLTPQGGGYCWGSNATGQLGVTDNSAVVVSEGRGGIAIARWGGTFANATRIASGLDHTCALHENKTVTCWGKRNSGQVGDASGTGLVRYFPNGVAGLSDVVDIAVGDKHSCAVLATGGVRCWGDNASGQLGNTSVVSTSASPVAVSGITDAVAVTAHSVRTCVLHATGRVSCWGSGMAGDGVTTNAKTPVYVAGLNDAVEVATSSGKTCALRTTGDVVCFGTSYLGDGTTGPSATLVTVSFPE